MVNIKLIIPNESDDHVQRLEDVFKKAIESQIAEVCDTATIVFFQRGQNTVNEYRAKIYCHEDKHLMIASIIKSSGFDVLIDPYDL